LFFACTFLVRLVVGEGIGFKAFPLNNNTLILKK
jgi:hypothetical protein